MTRRPPAVDPHAAQVPDVDDGLRDGEALLLIDWGCGFCQRTRSWLQAHAPRGALRFEALSSAAGERWLARCGRPTGDRSTVVLVEAGPDGLRCTDRSTAVLRTVRRMHRPYRWLAVARVVPRPLRDWGYKLVSRHRHRL